MAIHTDTNGHYSLHAYVTNGNVLRLNQPNGRVTFSYIFQNRPRDYRYAVAGHYSAELHGDEILAWDLYEARKDPTSGRVFAPKPRLITRDVESAIFATLILYHTEVRR